MDRRERIEVRPGVRSGKPIVKGTRITVEDVLGYLSAGTPESQLLIEFPQLAHDDVLACLAYATDPERKGEK